MLFVEEPKFVSVVVRGKKLWMDEKDFNQMAEWRLERIATGVRYNTGPLIRDVYADAGEQLVPGGNATITEVAIFASSQYEMEQIFGMDWSMPRDGETRRNPQWK